MSNLIKFNNNAKTTVATQLLVAGTTLAVAIGDGAKFETVASPDIMYLTLENTIGDIEVVQVTSHALNADSFTIVRAQEGTIAIQWEVGDTVELRLTSGILNTFAQFDFGGNAKGANSINLQPGRTVATNVASFDNSIAIGYDTKADGRQGIAIGDNSKIGGSYSTAIGQNADTGYGAGSLAFGYKATAGFGNNCISIGTSTNASGNSSSIAMGYYSQCSGNYAISIGYRSNASYFSAISIGRYSDSSANSGVAIGDYAKAIGVRGVAIGQGSYGAADSVVIGGYASNNGYTDATVLGKSSIARASFVTVLGQDGENNISKTSHIVYPIAIKDNGQGPSIGGVAADRSKHLSGTSNIITTEVVDGTALSDIDFGIPTGFFVEEAGVIAVEATGVTTQPTVYFGNATGTFNIVAATLTTQLSASGKRERFTSPLLSNDLQSNLWCGVATIGAGTSIKLRFYIKGFFITSSPTNA